MKEQDFYELNIGQEIWYKGEKKTVVVLSIGIYDENVSFGEGGLTWKDICADCSLEEPFETKDDCVHFDIYRDTMCKKDIKNCHSCESYEKVLITKTDCVNYHDTSEDGKSLICKGKYSSCVNCEFYEKEKKLVKYYAFPYGDGIGWSSKKDNILNCKGNLNKYPIKICPDSNRVYIEVPNE